MYLFRNKSISSCSSVFRPFLKTCLPSRHVRFDPKLFLCFNLSTGSISLLSSHPWFSISNQMPSPLDTPIPQVCLLLIIILLLSSIPPQTICLTQTSRLIPYPKIIRLPLRLIKSFHISVPKVDQPWILLPIFLLTFCPTPKRNNQFESTLCSFDLQPGRDAML